MMRLLNQPAVRRLLTPKELAQSILHISGEALVKRGIRGVILDLDNTLLAWDQEHIEPQVLAHLASWRRLGLQFGVVSNNMEKRVRRLAAQLHAPYASRAYKPAKSGYVKVARAMGCASAELAVVGDQLYTDVLGGNRMGFYTIWVLPVSSREFGGTKITRMLERWTWKVLQEQQDNG